MNLSYTAEYLRMILDIDFYTENWGGVFKAFELGVVSEKKNTTFVVIDQICLSSYPPHHILDT